MVHGLLKNGELGQCGRRFQHSNDVPKIGLGLCAVLSL